MGIAKALVEADLKQARAFGYQFAQLDSLRFMTSAYYLYQSLGFYETAPYSNYNPTLKPYVRFLELKLTN